MNAKSPTPAQVIIVTRMIWVALLLGQVMFAVIIGVTVSQSPQADTGPVDTRLLLYISLAMLATMLPVALLLRSRLMNRDGTVVSAKTYVSANIVGLAICESQTVALLAFGLFTHQLTPFFGLAAAPLVVFLAMFPRNPGWKA